MNCEVPKTKGKPLGAPHTHVLLLLYAFVGEHGPYSVSSATAVEFNWQSGLWDFDGVCGDSLVPRAGGRRSAGYLQTGELGVFHGASFRFSFLSRGAMCEFFFYKKGEQDTCFVGGSGHHELHEMFMIIASNIEDAQHILTLFKTLKLNAIPHCQHEVAE